MIANQSMLMHGQGRCAPVLVPDPDLISHIEGNKRIIRREKAAARAHIRELVDSGRIDPSDDRLAGINWR